MIAPAVGSVYVYRRPMSTREGERFVVAAHADRGSVDMLSLDGAVTIRVCVRGDLDGSGGYGRSNWAATNAVAVPSVVAEAIAARDAIRAEAIRQREEAEAMQRAGRAIAEATRPDWAVAHIVARLEQDDCDLHTDYFGTKTKAVVFLAWSKTKRAGFAELRKAAALRPETADLATAPKDAEHRERYSMGGGLYLKAGGRWSSGWSIHKAIGTVPGYDIAEAIGREGAAVAVAPRCYRCGAALLGQEAPLVDLCDPCKAERRGEVRQ